MHVQTVIWRRSEHEPVPRGIWLYGIFYDSAHGNTEPCPIYKDLYHGNVWAVSISNLDGSPVMEVRDEPTLWRFV